jgi:hypothetical protein
MEHLEENDISECAVENNGHAPRNGADLVGHLERARDVGCDDVPGGCDDAIQKLRHVGLQVQELLASLIPGAR